MKYVLAIMSILLVGLNGQALPPTNHASILGVWVPVAASNSIVRVVVSPNGSGIRVRPFGSCSPTPCDHGWIAASSFSSGVSSNVTAGFNASKSFGFKRTLYTASMSGSRLIVTTYDTFASGDNRRNYFSRIVMRKLVIAPELQEDSEAPSETLEVLPENMTLD